MSDTNPNPPAAAVPLPNPSGGVTPSTEACLLTIGVPAIPSRLRTSMPAIVEKLTQQADGKPVEVLCLIDNKVSTISQKLNALVNLAHGMFFTCVDDDDDVTDDYVDALLELIREQGTADGDAASLDCIVFDAWVTQNGANGKVCKYGTEFSHANTDLAYHRKPNHLMAHRTEQIRGLPFLDEPQLDTAWAERRSRQIRRQGRIDRVLYRYLWSAAGTESPEGQELAARYRWLPAEPPAPPEVSNLVSPVDSSDPSRPATRRRFHVDVVQQPHAEAFAEVASLVAATLIDLDLAGSATDTRIVFGAHGLADASALRQDAILFNLEPSDSPQVRNNEPYLRLLRGHSVWDFSERNARGLGSLGIQATWVPLGYHPTESPIIKEKPPQDIDVLFYGTLNQRRQAVLQQLASAGVTVKHSQAYGAARDRDIARARIVLNVHYYPSSVLEMVRLAYLLANEVCIVSEGGPPDDPAYAVRGVVFSPYETLVDTCIQLLQDNALRADTAQVGYDSFRLAPMTGILTQALAKLPTRAAHTETTQARAHICLCMIVKNEAPVIRRCLAAVLPHIDSWIVVDTGSTDGTQEIVRAVLTGKPGALHERPWVNFGHNRSEAFDLASATGAQYALVMDADDVLVGSARLPELSAGVYFLETRRGTTRYRRPHLFKLDLGWRYEGRVHGSPVSRIPAERAHIDTFHVDSYSDGARSQDPLKFRRDAAAIEQALLEQPDNTRYVFYLAQSYRDAGMVNRAIECYERRVTMGGWPQECWYAGYQAALLSPRDADWVDRMLRAYDLLPTRVETLYHLARFYRLAGCYRTAFAFAAIGHDLLVDEDHHSGEGLFIDAAIYSWMMDDEYAIAAHWAGRYAEARRTCEQLLSNPAVPPAELERIRTNLGFAMDASASGD